MEMDGMGYVSQLFSIRVAPSLYACDLQGHRESVVSARASMASITSAVTVDAAALEAQQACVAPYNWLLVALCRNLRALQAGFVAQPHLSDQEAQL
jgi:hypothetical protein